MIQDVFQDNGVWNVTLYNPWGIDGYVVQGADDGLITISWASFQLNFEDYAWEAHS
jgi:hypothetical protein